MATGKIFPDPFAFSFARREVAMDEIDAVGTTPSPLMSPEQTAAYLRIGRTFCYELLREGTIPSFTIGRRRFVRRTDVDAFINERARASLRRERGQK
jgi:excisionase family DNA binding protein